MLVARDEHTNEYQISIDNRKINKGSDLDNDKINHYTINGKFILGFSRTKIFDLMFKIYDELIKDATIKDQIEQFTIDKYYKINFDSHQLITNFKLLTKVDNQDLKDYIIKYVLRKYSELSYSNEHLSTIFDSTVSKMSMDMELSKYLDEFAIKRFNILCQYNTDFIDKVHKENIKMGIESMPSEYITQDQIDKKRNDKEFKRKVDEVAKEYKRRVDEARYEDFKKRYNELKDRLEEAIRKQEVKAMQQRIVEAVEDQNKEATESSRHSGTEGITSKLVDENGDNIHTAHKYIKGKSSDLIQLQQLLSITWDGDLIDKSAVKRLKDKGLMVKVDGWNIITVKGVELLNSLNLIHS